MTDSILYDVADGVAVVTLNRPEKLNAINTAMNEELLGIFDVTDADDSVRAVVVTGAGRAFCAGADLTAKADTFDFERDPGGVVALRIFRSLKPIIAAINGPAAGYGATLILPMDIRVMSEGAKLAFAFAARGIVPDAASSWFLPRAVGMSTALEWCLTARPVLAEEALSSRLVRSVHPAEDVLPVAVALARQIAANVAPVSAVLTRQLMWQMQGAAHPIEANRIESQAIHHTGGLADAKEGIASFLEKRPACWTLGPSTGLPDWFPWIEEPSY